MRIKKWRTVALAILSISAVGIWVGYDVLRDVKLRFGQHERAEGKITSVARASIWVEYTFEGTTYKVNISRGILRFEFPRVGTPRAVLFSKEFPGDAILEDPIGGWFFWTTDLAIDMAILSYALVLARQMVF